MIKSPLLLYREGGYWFKRKRIYTSTSFNSPRTPGLVLNVILRSEATKNLVLLKNETLRFAQSDNDVVTFNTKPLNREGAEGKVIAG
jgi:hypothetical protein